EQVVLVDVGRRERVVVVGKQLRTRPGDAVRRVEVQDEHVLEIGKPGDAIADRGPALRVTEQQLGARVAQTELELLGLPPRIERYGDGADRRGRPPQHNPFDVVRRQNRYAIAVTDPEVYERRRDSTHERVVVAVVDPAIALHEKVRAGAPVGHRDQVGKRVQTVLVDLERHPEHVLGDDLERAARS